AQDGTKYQFHISDNEGSSSSIFEPSKQFAAQWATTGFSSSIELEAISLSTFIRTQSIDMASFDILILDTQGSELLVLEGAKEVLPRFRYIQLEAVNREIYSGCCKLPEVDAFLSKCGFKQKGRRVLRRSPKGGREWDVLYQRVEAS
ncbi:MAG: FkbM family methyltransferase, partial [Acidobacteriaceae bacterium]